ncbi:MAG: metal-dependent hydrolase [Desulfohalobiaceae bacterium]
MPGYKAHGSVGLLTGAGILAGAYWMGWYEPEPRLILVLLVFVFLGSLFPDIDTDSASQRFFYGLLALFSLSLMLKGLYKWAGILGFCAMFPALSQHRRWTHTWWAMLGVPLLVAALPVFLFETPWQILVPFYLAAVWGYFSHLVLDRQF